MALLEWSSKALLGVGLWMGAGSRTGREKEGLGSRRPGCEACLQYRHINCGTSSSRDL